MEKINFQSKGQRVDGTLFIPNNTKRNPGVIFFHGLGSNEKRYLPMAETLCAKGFTVLTFNFRGHANVNAEDNITAHDGISDGLAAYDFFVKQKGVDPNRIGLCGSSFGAVVAIHVAEKRKVESILLRAPALYKAEMMTKSIGKILADENRIFNDMHNIKDNEMMKIISRFNGNLLVVQSEKDDLIPASLSEAFLKEARKSKKRDLKVIKNAPHSIKDPEQRQEFMDILTKWFTETL